MKYLIIAGHGQRRNGTFDPGAIGLISKGEHRYMKENLFPAMKKYANGDFIFYDRRNVFSHGDLVSLARSYGKDTAVVEFHYDAGSSVASGGHVIVYSHFKPDAMDLRIRDAINSMVGVRYTHAGQRGISGRNNLGNVNRAASGGINYRLVELGFGTNAKDADVMLNQTDQYAKKLVEAIKNAKVDKVSTPLPPSKPVKPQASKPKPAPTTGGSVVNYMNSKGMNSSYNNRAKLAGQYGIKNYKGTASQNIELLNKLKSGAPTKPTLKSNKTVAQEVIDGKWGNNPQRSQKLKNAGYNASAIQAEVNRILQGGFDARSIANQIKKGIDNRGRRIPNGHANRQRHFGLTSTQYAQVRRLVNK